MSLEKIIVKKAGYKSQAAFFKTLNKKSKSFYKDNFFMGKEKYLQVLSGLMNEIIEDSEIYNELKSSKKPVKKKYIAELELFNTNYNSKLKTFENHIRFFKK